VVNVGSRGPISKAVQGKSHAGHRPSTALPVEVLAPGEHRLVPAEPEGLGEVGLAVWRDAWRAAWIAESDAGAVEHLARLTDERNALCKARDASGLTLKEPIVTPKGEIVGERLVPNPLLAEIRRLDAIILAARKELGLTPMAKARLGLNVASAANQASRIHSPLRDLLMGNGAEEEIEVVPDV
jgi:hypothetical protein